AAHVGLGSGDQHRIDPHAAQNTFERRRTRGKRAVSVLDDDNVFVAGFKLGVNSLILWRIVLQRTRTYVTGNHVVVEQLPVAAPFMLCIGVQYPDYRYSVFA